MTYMFWMVEIFFRKFCDSDLTERFARGRLVFNVS